jgi:hypothetical protein
MGHMKEPNVREPKTPLDLHLKADPIRIRGAPVLGYQKLEVIYG